MSDQVVFWNWTNSKLLGSVTQASVYHWSIDGDSEPAKMFDRTANLANNQIIDYRCDPMKKWLVLIGIAPGTPERPQLVKGNMQLFSVDQQRSQALEAHAACFATFKVSHKYGLINVIKKLGLLFVYELETTVAVYRNRISPDHIFLTEEPSSTGGFYAINRRGQVLHATVNDVTVVPFVSGQV
ncbi:hypothetical protein PVAP13_3NG298306 [Panicum virgatum]|uniref:Uncharacterized protein n=1 Tax=Panicum virgatum TaxID=38727 RepID=A0A8T0ULF6_PANVG|nr:hypothetical protein PVAP13_3NG298306 [Panicum virgatum]KAG2621926.1 hypothetical protein PVAP13_3NG298306 [Panicum virgatum]KAG2621927.1 hypothetical protein PVAP13_3NG298306 [Panicum virgatum]